MEFLGDVGVFCPLYRLSWIFFNLYKSTTYIKIIAKIQFVKDKNSIL